MVVISLDSPSCGVCLFYPRTGGCIGTLPDRPRIVPFEVRLSQCCLYGDGLRTWAGIIQVVLPHRPPNIPALHFETFVLLCCLQVWKRRNGVVFRGDEATVIQLLQSWSQAVGMQASPLPTRRLEMFGALFFIRQCKTTLHSVTKSFHPSGRLGPHKQWKFRWGILSPSGDPSKKKQVKY